MEKSDISSPMKKTFFYKLFDPREPHIARYIGKADKPNSRFNSHLKEATYEDSKHLPKSIWINSLLTAGFRPEISVIDEIEYIYASEWCDNETFLIAKHLLDGNTLENASQGGLHPLKHNFVEERKNIWSNNKNGYTKFKLDEAVMYKESIGFGSTFETAWVLRKKFWSGIDDVCSRFQLEIARVDWLKSKLKTFDVKYCNFCGTSLDIFYWDNIKDHFSDFMDIFETYTYDSVLNEFIAGALLSKSCENIITQVKMCDYKYGIANSSDFKRMLNHGLHMKRYTGDPLHRLQDGSVVVCDCDKTDKIYFKINSPVRKINSYDSKLSLLIYRF